MGVFAASIRVRLDSRRASLRSDIVVYGIRARGSPAGTKHDRKIGCAGRGLSVWISKVYVIAELASRCIVVSSRPEKRFSRNLAVIEIHN